jgi:hypothetical protein
MHVCYIFLDGLNCYFVITVTTVTVTSISYKITFRDHRHIFDLCNGSQLKPVAVTGCIAVDFSCLFNNKCSSLVPGMVPVINVCQWQFHCYLAVETERFLRHYREPTWINAIDTFKAI